MIGNVVGNYKLVEKIGEGGMGAVFKGIDLMLEREVAIKVLRPDLASQPHVVERFRSEAVTLAKLSHPNIAALYSFFRQRDDFFMVMEFMHGSTLDSILADSGAMRCETAIPLFCHALEGVGYAHRRGVVHRDIKPSNMMLTDDGVLKVMDFGIARVLGSARMTRAGSLIGTIEYMPPEQIRGEEADARSDIYSLGVLLYELLSGRVPFSSTNEYELMKMQIEATPPLLRGGAPHIPEGVERAIMRALAKRPEERFAGANEFRQALLQAEPFGADAHATTYTTGALSVFGKRDADGGPALAVGGTSQSAGTDDSGGGVSAVPPSREIKETRVESGVENYLAAKGGVVKETRLAQSIIGTQAASQAQGVRDSSVRDQEMIYSSADSSQAGGLPASVFSRLNWKHYAGGGAAAALLVALLAVSLTLTGGGEKKTPTLKPGANDLSTEVDARAKKGPAGVTPAVPASVAPAPSPSALPVEETLPIFSSPPDKPINQARPSPSVKPSKPAPRKPIPQPPPARSVKPDIDQ